MLQDASVIIQNNSQDFNKVLLDGSFDTSFGVGGVATISSTLVYKRAYASDSSGNFYIYGLGNGSDQYIQKFTSAGVPDSTFGTNGVADISSVPIISGGGGIRMAASTSGVYISHFDRNIIKFDSSGILDTNFGTSGEVILSVADTGSVRIDEMDFDSNGNLIVAGIYENSSYSSAGLLALRLDAATGAVDNTFNNGNYKSAFITDLSAGYGGQAAYLSVDSSDNLYLGGRIATSNLVIEKINSSGIDTNFANNGTFDLNTFAGGTFEADSYDAFGGVDNADNLYIMAKDTDALKYIVVKIDAQGTATNKTATDSNGERDRIFANGNTARVKYFYQTPDNDLIVVTY